MCKMLLIPGTIFCAHFQGVKNMDLGTGHMDLIRQRGNKIGVELVFAARGIAGLLPGAVGASGKKHCIVNGKTYLEQAGFCQIQSHKNKKGWLCITAQK